ncbi:MAG TPA: response regulator transcription factor [Actinomycetota bacterium]|nr:response regulator transcription factor [Actinomycetota bacterium]
MIRLLWLSPERADPEESFPPLAGKRPAPEPISFYEATPELLGRRLADVVVVDGRQRPEEAAGLMRKLRNEIEAPFVVVLNDHELKAFDWSSGPVDFLTDRCTPNELDARLKRVIQPEEPDSGDVIRRGELTINRDRFEVRVQGEVLDLTFKEFELIAYLAQRPGRVCSRRALLSEVWGYDFFGGTRTVDVHVRRLRAKLGHEAHMIETVRNVGYRFAG